MSTGIKMAKLLTSNQQANASILRYYYNLIQKEKHTGEISAYMGYIMHISKNYIDKKELLEILNNLEDKAHSLKISSKILKSTIFGHLTSFLSIDFDDDIRASTATLIGTSIQV